MTIYSFKCPCGTQLEEQRKFGDNKAPPCPHCEHEMSQVIQANPFILRGKGWYKNSHHDKM